LTQGPGKEVQGAALVVGGGVAGMRASLDLAGMGIPVHLVEREPFLGGRMLQLDRIYPTDHCAWCPVWPMMRGVGSHPLIKIHCSSELGSITRESGAYRGTILHHPTYIHRERCTGCGECLTACARKNSGAGGEDRQAVLRPMSYVFPKAFVIDRTLCRDCRSCQPECPFGAIDFQMQGETTLLEIGAVIVASGFDPGSLEGLEELSYGAHPDIISAMDFENWIAETGPKAGQVLRRSDGRRMERLAFVLCAGSRDRRFHEYCSGICCMYAVKEAVWACQRSKELRATIFFTDLRASGKGFQEYVQMAEKTGRIQFIRSRPGRIEPVEEKGTLRILYEDTTERNTLEMAADMVVLTPPIIPAAGMDGLSAILNIERDPEGFVLLSDDKLHSSASSKSGVSACGCCQGPADAVQSVISASAAAFRAAEIITRGKVL
jgi:heterodisulfide reductase subunit A